MGVLCRRLSLEGLQQHPEQSQRPKSAHDSEPFFFFVRSVRLWSAQAMAAWQPMARPSRSSEPYGSFWGRGGVLVLGILGFAGFTRDVV